MHDVVFDNNANVDVFIQETNVFTTTCDRVVRIYIYARAVVEWVNLHERG